MRILIARASERASLPLRASIALNALVDFAQVHKHERLFLIYRSLNADTSANYLVRIKLSLIFQYLKKNSDVQAIIANLFCAIFYF